MSEDLLHGKLAVTTFLSCILSDVKDRWPGVKEVNFFSDGATRQFKQKFLFANLEFLSTITASLYYGASLLLRTE